MWQPEMRKFNRAVTFQSWFCLVFTVGPMIWEAFSNLNDSTIYWSRWKKLSLILKIASMNNDLRFHSDFSNELSICVFTNGIRRFNIKTKNRTFCNSVICSYFTHKFRLFITLWKHNWALRDWFISLTQIPLKIQFTKVPRHSCKSLLTARANSTFW